MRHEIFFGIVDKAASIKPESMMLHYADRVLFLGGNATSKTGRGKSVLLPDCPVGSVQYPGFRVVYGTDDALVFDELVKELPLIFYVSPSKPSAKIKSLLKSSGGKKVHVGEGMSGIARIVAVDGKPSLVMWNGEDWVPPVKKKAEPKKDEPKDGSK